MILDNYVLDFYPNEELIFDKAVLSVGVVPVAVHVVEDELNVSRLDLESVGQNYTTATVTFSQPQLPGGVPATGEALVSGGYVYAVNLLTPGSGYTERPSSIVDGDGTGASATVRVSDGRKAVDMGVCTSSDATAATYFTRSTSILGRRKLMLW